MIKIFDNISAPNKAKLEKLLKAHRFTFKKETTILSTVNSSNVIGVIVKGYAEIIRTDHNGNRTIIEELEEEDIFGTEISSLKNKEFDIVVITKKTIRNKLLEYFSVFSSSRYIYLPSTFSALADYLAIDRSAMSRELKCLKEEGFIEIKGKRIKLLYSDNWL